MLPHPSRTPIGFGFDIDAAEFFLYNRIIREIALKKEFGGLCRAAKTV